MNETKLPKLELVGEDGNAFYIIGKAVKVAKKAGWDEERIKKFQEDCFSGDYDNVLQLCMKNFDVC